MSSNDKEIINKIKPLTLSSESESIDLTWINIWNSEIRKEEFCLITFYNVKCHIAEEDLKWCNILVTNALPRAVGQNLCNLLKTDLKTYGSHNEDIVWNMKIYRELSQEFWPEIDILYKLVLDAKEKKTL